MFTRSKPPGNILPITVLLAAVSLFNASCPSSATVLFPTTRAVNVGAGMGYRAADGTLYEPDSAYIVEGNTTIFPDHEWPDTFLAGEADRPLYMNGRSGVEPQPNFSYTFSGLSNGNYTVKLHFVETMWPYDGKRLFAVWINGAPLRTDLDVYHEANDTDNPLVLIHTSVSPTNESLILVEFQLPAGVDCVPHFYTTLHCTPFVNAIAVISENNAAWPIVLFPLLALGCVFMALVLWAQITRQLGGDDVERGRSQRANEGKPPGKKSEAFLSFQRECDPDFQLAQQIHKAVTPVEGTLKKQLWKTARPVNVFFSCDANTDEDECWRQAMEESKVYLPLLSEEALGRFRTGVYTGQRERFLDEIDFALSLQQEGKIFIAPLFVGTYIDQTYEPCRFFHWDFASKASERQELPPLRENSSRQGWARKIKMSIRGVFQDPPLESSETAKPLMAEAAMAEGKVPALVPQNPKRTMESLLSQKLRDQGVFIDPRHLAESFSMQEKNHNRVLDRMILQLKKSEMDLVPQP